MFINNSRIKIPKEYIFSFLLPVIFVSAAFAAAGVYPCGIYSMITSDLQEQFLPLAGALFGAVKHNGSIFYSYGSGFGTDLFLWGISLLTDPLNILFLLFPIETYQEIFLFTYIIKIGLTGLCACVFFSKSALMRTKDGSCLSPAAKVALSTMYALCMYSITYSLLVSLVTNITLFPLCLLAQERLTEKKRFAAFTAVYFICVINSFYYAYLTGVCCFIYLIYYTTMRGKSAKEFLQSVLLLCFAAGVSICLSGIFTIPAAANILLNYNTTINTTQTSLIFLNFKVLMHGLLLISDSAVAYTKLDIFFGLAPLIFSLMLVFSKKISLRERIITLCITAFYFAAIVLTPLYIIMHMGHIPISFNARFAYCMSFTFMIFAARALLQYADLAKKSLMIPFILLLIGLNAALSYQSSVFYLINSLVLLIFMIIYAAAFLSKRSAVKITSVIIICEAFLTCFTGIQVIKRMDGYPGRQYWTHLINAAKEPFNYTKETDSGFYRQTDLTQSAILAPLVSGYNSYTIFSSSANQPANTFARGIGCLSPADHLLTNRFGTVVSDSILGVKYLAADDISKKLTDINGKGAYSGIRGRINTYDKVKADNNYEIYKNPFAFPIMFAANESSETCGKDFQNTSSVIDGAFSNQEELISGIVGKKNELYTRYDIGDASFTNCKPNGDENTVYTPELTNLPEDAPYAVSGDEAGIITYSFPVKDAGEYCSTFYFDLGTDDIANDMFALWVDGIPSDYTYVEPCFSCDLGNYAEGETIEIRIMLRRSGINMAKPTLLRLDKEKFEKISRDIQNNAPTDQCETNGTVTANCNYAKDTFIFTTIAYNDGLKVFIDGQEVQKIRAADALLAFTVPSGSHSIKITYTTPFLKGGIILSAVSALLCFAAWIIRRKQNDKK